MKLLLYSSVISITEEPNIIDKFYSALQTISENSRSDIKFCDIEKFKSNREQFKNLKYLYEFLFTYYDINGKISPHLNTNDQLYCNYIKENFRLYNDIKEKCPTVGICPYSKELGEIKKIFITQKHLSQIYRKCNYVQTPCKEDSDETNDIPCLKNKGSNSPSPIKDPEQDKVAKNIFDGLTYTIPTLATLTMLYKVNILFFY
ncbi:hypothetical protein PVIIG_05284 [Plasmodium vivax India VII]|uniref:Uncharacterized protein n=1 Tax=Plasmodium vivax India VII TaxID=1077284 RepID=A0A0J9S3I0_PLAVI|nr:hypothetical protein PVIIG_05284 [Plasmodium vivax India VII]